MPSTSPPLTQGTSEWLQEHLDIVKKRILDEAVRLAKLDNRQEGIEPRDIAEAAKRFAPGIEIPSVPDLVVDTPSFGARILAWTPSTITVSALLAVAFGILGVYRGGQGAFDIAKVFAGAIVGSAATAVRSNAKQK